MELLGAEGVSGQADVRPDLVEQRADRNADGLAPLAGRPLRRLAAGRVCDGRKAGAADFGACDTGDEFGVAGSDIHRSDEHFHDGAPSEET